MMIKNLYAVKAGVEKQVQLSNRAFSMAKQQDCPIKVDRSSKRNSQALV